MKSLYYLILVFFLLLPASLRAQTVFTVDNTGDSGPGSLRQAILDANANPNSGGPDLIQFNIPGPGVQTIAPLTVLPDITDPVVVDGYSQPGSSPNTNGPSQGLNAVLLIELSGVNISNADGLTVTGGDSLLKGLVVNRFGTGGFFGAGISLDTAGGNTVEGCFLGTDPTGTLSEPNLTRGLFVTSDDNVIGGTLPAARNLISGNGERGVFIIDADNNTVQGNLIGTDISGTLALGNGSEGINLQTSVGNRIGGSTPAERNIISANGSAGISFISFVLPAASGNFIQGNYIGTDVGGTQDLGNAEEGVVFSGNVIADNSVGGTNPGEGNLIAFNGGDGVFVAQGNGMGILGNAIFSNGALGIELSPGANNDQPSPVLASASLGGGLSVQGTLNAAPSTTYTIELFANGQCDPSGNGEGETFLGRISVTTDGSGQSPVDFALADAFQFSAANYSVNENAGTATITVTRILAAVSGQSITATATDPNDNTSAFSNCLAVCGSDAASVDFATSDGTAVAGLDYEANSGTLNFGDGDTSAEFEVTILGDSQSEADETVDLTLSNPSGGADLGDPNAAVLTIVNAASPNKISGGGCALQVVEAGHPMGLAFGAALLLCGFAIFRIRRIH